MQGVSKLGGVGEGLATGLWALEPQEYSPEVKAYLAEIDRRVAELGGDYYNPLMTTGELNNGDVSMPAYATDAYLRQFINQDPNENIGYAYAPEGKWGTTGVVSAGAGTNVRLVDDKTGQVIYAGTGIEGAQEAQRRIAEMGGSAPWSIYEAPAGTDDYYRWAQNEPQQSTLSGLGQLIATVGPVVAGGVMAPLAPASAASGAATTGTLVGGLGTSLGTQALVQAGIAAGGGALQGKSISKIAFDAAKAAGMTWAAGEYGDDLMRSAGLTPTGPGPGVADAVGTAAGGAGSAVGSADEIIISGTRNLVGSASGALTGAANTNALQGGSGGDTLDPDSTIDVTGTRQTTGVAPVGNVATGVNGALNGDPYTGDPGGEIEVRGRLDDPNTYLPPLAVSPVSTGTIGPDGVPVEPETYTGPEAEPEESLLDKISRYGPLASLGIGVIGNALGGLGGGGRSGDRRVPSGFQSRLNPDFKGPSLASLVAARQAGQPARTPRVLPPQDFSKQGFRPAQSYFSDVPQTYTPPLPGEEDPRYPSIGRGYARGGKVRGRSLAVRGPGTDRSDDIPAMLSDGEYVIDAPTVRKIGRGSTERGFDKLDTLRVDVNRKRPHRALKSLGAR